MSTKLRVLFVDDEPSVLHAIQRSLRHLESEWDIHTATSGDAALRILARVPFDVLVTDLRMPGLDGAELAHEVLIRYPWMVRIMLTGMVDQQSFERGTVWSQRILSKPCSTEVLRSEIRQAIARRELDRGLVAQHTDGAMPAASTVLMVADDPQEVTLLRQALLTTRSLVDVRSVADGESALAFLGRIGEHVSAPTPDLILLDLHLPKMSSFEFLSRYRASGWPTVPVIIVSAATRERDIEQAIRHGAAAFVPKPWTWDRYLDLARVAVSYATPALGTARAPALTGGHG